MRILTLFLIGCLFALTAEVKAKIFDDSQGLPFFLYTTLQPESIIDKKLAGEIDSFGNESSKDSNSCSSCGS